MMGGRGRGRGGRGASSSFNREQLYSMGFSAGEAVPGPVTQPPPLFPLLERKPLPLTMSKDTDYMLILKQDFIEHLQYASACVNLAQQIKEPEFEIDKLLAQLPKIQESCKFDWGLLPKELRTKVVAKRRLKNDKKLDLDTRLKQLEELEQKHVGPKIKTEVVEPEEEEDEVMEDEADEEMDEGTDYVNNYFDNGESYEDEDDNLDDGPIY